MATIRWPHSLHAISSTFCQFSPKRGFRKIIIGEKKTEALEHYCTTKGIYKPWVPSTLMYIDEYQ